MTHTMLSAHCDCPRCDRDRYEAKAVSVIVVLLAAMAVGLLFTIGVLS